MITFKETIEAAEILIERQLTPKEYKKFRNQLRRMVGKTFRGRLDLFILRKFNKQP